MTVGVRERYLNDKPASSCNVVIEEGKKDCLSSSLA